MKTSCPQSLRLITVVGLAFLALVPAAVSQQFPFVLAARHAFNLNGNGALFDSFDSSNPAKSTNGRYDASKYTGDFGDVAIDDSVIVGVGNATIYGKLHVGPGGSASLGPNGGVGTHAWQAANGGGLEPGYFLQDASFTFGDTPLPNTTAYLTPQPGVVVVRQTNSVLVTNYYDNVLYANTKYVSSALNGQTVVMGHNVTLVLPNGLTGAENFFFDYTDNINPGLTIYAGGTSASISGNQYINPSGFAGSLIIYCSPTVTSFTLNSSGQFTGVLVAPNANLTLNGGGSTNDDFFGSLIVNYASLHGYFSFHWDESLSRLPGSPPSITAQPQSRTVTIGQPATFTVSVAGSFPLSCQWQFAGTNIPNATESSFTIPSTSASDAGNYSVIVTNAFGSAVSSNAVLTMSDFPVIVVQPQSQTVGVGSNVTFNVTVYGAPPFVFQWYFKETPLGSPATGTNFSSCTLTNVGANQGGNYSVQVVNGYGSVTSSNAVLTVEVFPPGITVQPSSLVVLAGTSAAFCVSVSGTAPSGYQWRFNGTSLLNATNAIYSIPSVGTNNAGNYAVVVSNSAGTATSSNAALTVVLSPKSQTNYASSTATFTATAFSPEPLNYQWQKNGTNLVEGGRLSGTTNRTLTIASVSDTDEANYGAVVSDAYGSVTTYDAALTVMDPPSIAVQPLDQRIMLGSSVSFSVSVSGTPPFSYQWRLNNADVSNATNATCAIQAVAATNTGNYSVVVTNMAGSVTSSNAFLTVIVPPTLTVQLWAGYPLLNLNGMLGSNFVVQYSTNLAGTNWMNLLSLTNLPASPYQFLDSGGVGQPARFYRAFMQ